MDIKLVGMKVFRQLVESGGVDEFVIQRCNGVYHMFATNRRRGVSFLLQERRGDYKSWTSIDRAAAFLFSLNITRFLVRNEDKENGKN
ncbi:hypothetical protein [Intestinirhabdus alba]|uniref:Uncharacterized protein n=1 Tax=Intestinirhabdus alba TaxID=2899544 RepID=A0A6L6IMR6_9ENTR|nr:hypothetical protein [Intestinirhabdus alba]MTH47495.1 hypothetical protein [Intestinirhabdus alba]